VTGVSLLKGIRKAIYKELAFQGIDIFFTYWRPYDKIMSWSVNNKKPDLIQKEIYLKRFPKGRFRLTEEPVKLRTFLASKDTGGVTGQIIHFEGGFIRESYNA